jgi:bifunctional DNA-binding transcriptional regulator/antitoxin component of YhaV-PrlF toxin-antitoxin module
MPGSHETTVTPEGRVLSPAELRRAAGFTPGARIHVRAEGEAIVLMTVDAARRRLHDIFAQVDGSLSEELISDRRAEARRDASGGRRPRGIYRQAP